MDVFVHPSSSEAMPVSIVEALMQGLPCIATPVGGIPDLIREGVEGALVPVGDAVALADAMARFAGMAADELSAFRRRARARYEEVCRPEVVGAQVAAIYREILHYSTPNGFSKSKM
jgi:glycosyltransferase involved in cell wall biosynthesis